MLASLNIYHHPSDDLQLIAFLVVKISWWDLRESFSPPWELSTLSNWSHPDSPTLDNFKSHQRGIGHAGKNSMLFLRSLLLIIASSFLLFFHIKMTSYDPYINRGAPLGGGGVTVIATHTHSHTVNSPAIQSTRETQHQFIFGKYLFGRRFEI